MTPESAPLIGRAADPDPLDTLLRQIAERAVDARARAWARRLLERGESATGSAAAAHTQRSHDSRETEEPPRENLLRRKGLRCHSNCAAPDAKQPGEAKP